MLRNSDLNRSKAQLRYVSSTSRIHEVSLVILIC